MEAAIIATNSWKPTEALDDEEGVTGVAGVAGEEAADEGIAVKAGTQGSGGTNAIMALRRRLVRRPPDSRIHV
jgi:hypothetical protein